MRYDLNIEIDRKRLARRVETLLADRKVVELTAVSPRRTLAQNSYLHLILTEFAMQSGNRLDYVKEMYFKKMVNADTFIKGCDDRYFGKVTTLRSTADISTAEMEKCITRFRNWASEEAGIYLPEPNEEEYLAYIETEAQRMSNYL